MKEEKTAAGQRVNLPIRSALIPVFYQKFHCLASECRDTCCIGWRITFDKKDYLRLRRLDAPDALKARLDEGVRRERKGNRDGAFYGKFDLDSNGGRCPFLDPDGLCAIQRACGHEALPSVCTTYPRKIAYSAAAKEYALSPSCEGVLQQLWDLPEGVEFVEDPLPKEEHRHMNVTPGESLNLFFEPVRALCVDILQNRAIPLTERMVYLGMVLQKLIQEDWGGFEPDRWAGRTAPSASPEMLGIPGNRKIFLMQNLKVLQSIGSDAGSWPTELCTALEVRQSISLSPKPEEDGLQHTRLTTQYSPEAYGEALERFQAAFAGREYFFENLMVASALYLGFPDLSGREELWKSYVSLCSLYSFYRFVSVLGCREEQTKERLFHFLVMASRSTLHSRTRFNGFQEELFQHESSSLAHMAILLRWS